MPNKSLCETIHVLLKDLGIFSSFMFFIPFIPFIPIAYCLDMSVCHIHSMMQQGPRLEAIHFIKSGIPYYLINPHFRNK